ncbi:MAG: amidohydrolase family protein [Rubrobacter sp.]
MTGREAKSLLDLPLREYRPVSRLVTRKTGVERASYPAVDFHNHLGRWLSEDDQWTVPGAMSLLQTMRALNVEAMVNLDGRWGEELEKNLDRYDRAHPDRFATFCHVDWDQARRPGFSERLVESLQRSAEAGAKGLKVWKDLGLRVRDPDGSLLMPDDPRLSTLWEAAGELNLPVLIHTADPVAFFDPVDETNERLEELLGNPDWSFHGPEFPSFGRLMEALEQVVAGHPQTTFIGAHFGCYAEDPASVGEMLDRYPNYFVDISARISELGRQPRASREAIVRNQDRVLFGTDVFPLEPDHVMPYFRFLETADEHFPYSPERVGRQGRWNIHGIDLPKSVLRRVYRDNARCLIPGIAQPSHQDMP